MSGRENILPEIWSCKFLRTTDVIDPIYDTGHRSQIPQIADDKLVGGCTGEYPSAFGRFTM